MPHIITNSTNPLTIDTGEVIVSNKFDKVLYFDKAATADKVTIPHHSSIDFGIQDNWAISTWFAPIVASTLGTRWQLFSKRSNPSGSNISGYELVLSQVTTESYTVIFNTFSNTLSNTITYTINEDIRGRWMHILFEKYNAVPASSVSAAEWKLTLSNVPVTPTVFSNTLIPASNIKNTIPVLINGLDQTSGGPAVDWPATFYQGPLSVFNTNSRQLTTAEKLFLFEMDGIVPPSLQTSMMKFVAPLNDSGGTTMTDKSGSGNHGVLANFANTTAGNPANAWRNGFTLNAA